jgi:hypothetical protein
MTPHLPSLPDKLLRRVLMLRHPILQQFNPVLTLLLVQLQGIRSPDNERLGHGLGRTMIT